MKASEIDIRECWTVIEDVLRTQAPRLYATLAAPASEAEIAELEQIIGLRLPSDLTASLRCHNGQRDPSRLWSLTDGGMLLSTSGIAESWRIVDSVHRDLLSQPPPVPGYTPEPWWKATLIPFTDAEGDMLCIDTDAALGSHYGQVIWHVHDDSLSSPIALSYAQWLADVASRIRNGGLCVEERSSYLRSER
jgi:cell wall assembly regulator SMI1